MKLDNIGISQRQELQQIIEQYLPLGNDGSLCHVGICSITRCSRCQAALKSRELIRILLGDK